MADNEKSVVSLRSGDPFTIPIIREILDRVLERPQTRPGSDELTIFIRLLNSIYRAFKYSQEIGGTSNEAQQVSEAFRVLEDYFEERREACQGDPSLSAAAIERERTLYNQFVRFLKKFHTHDFLLEMDWVGMRSSFEDWHDLAEPIANGFQVIMARNKCRLGRSNEAVPRFVAEVIPLITGERPTIAAVGQHLKLARQRRKGQNATKADN